jgi:ligand-binding SRPBCC domain-containing protein
MAHKVFEHKSILPGTVEQAWAFHAQPGAFSKLTPPPIFVQMIDNQLKSLTEGTVDFRLWFGPIPVHWIARHEPGLIPTSFTDRQVSGPLAYWEHQHVMRPVTEGVELLDHITLEHKSGLAGWLTRLFFDGLPLRFLFVYRHWRTRQAMHHTGY